MNARSRLAQSLQRIWHRSLRNWKRIGSVIVIALLLGSAYISYTSIDLRVGTADAEKRLESTDTELQKLERDAVNSQELGATTIDYGKRTVTPLYIADLNHLAVRVLSVRAPLLSNANVSFQHDLLLDIGNLVQELNGCGTMSCDTINKSVTEYKQGYADVVQTTQSVGAILTGTKALLRVHESDRLEDSIQVIKLVSSACDNPHMLIHDTGKPAFDDVDQLEQTTWDLYHIHQNLLASYHERDKLKDVMEIFSHHD